MMEKDAKNEIKTKTENIVRILFSLNVRKDPIITYM